MNLATRTIFILVLLFALTGELIGQEASTTTTATTTAAATTATTTDTTTATTTDTAATTTTNPASAQPEPAAEAESESEPAHFGVRNEFTRMLQNHPYELWMILKLDPSLLSNEAFMSGYPEVRDFVARHPEILKNPRFYLAQFHNPAQDRNVMGDLFEFLAVIGGIGITVFALAWLIRTLIEQKRWKQLTRTQNEVHNKILERFSTNEQLIEYIRSPAGTKFLESAPIPLHVERPSRQANTPASRIMWSVQLGVIVAIAGLGMLLLSLRFDRDSSDGLFALGAIALCVGAGFIASAAVSLKLSRRLGLWQEGDGPSPVDDSGLVR
jgi:hypothetical protein